MRQICLVEDSSDLQGLMRMHLEDWFKISTASSLQEARKILAAEKIDLLLLDVNLPDGNGFEFCAELKSDRRTMDIPVIFLTGKNEPIDKLMGFRLGAADYVVKPFEPIEVRARIEARLRSGGPMAAPAVAADLTAGPVRFDRVRQRAYMNHEGAERDLGLTPLEFKLLHFLASNQDQVFNRGELMKSVQEPGVHVNEETVYTHVSAIRRKLAGQAALLECIPRVGYRFLVPPKRAA